MAFYTNPLNFPNLTSKATPVGADLIMIADSAAGNAIKQATITNIVAGGSSGSALTKIATQTASNSATIDFSNNLSSTYDNYLIVMENVVPATNGAYLQSRIGTGGTPTYQTTNYHGSVMCGRVITADTYLASLTTPTTSGFMDIVPNVAGSLMSNTSTSGNGGSILITNANDATNDKTIASMFSYVANGSTSGTGNICAIGSGRWNGATVLTSFRLLMSSGNITSGVFKLYGYQN